MQKLGSIGERVDYDLRAGCTFGDSFQLLDETGAPVDLTGATLAGAVSLRDGGATADLPLTVTITNAAQGKVSFELSAATTATLQHSGDFFKAGPLYAWRLNITMGSRTDPLFAGLLNVAPAALP